MIRQTEVASLRYRGLDLWDDASILDALLEGQFRAIGAVQAARTAVQHAAGALVERLLDEQSRLVYVGAGVSGHLALMDGMEMNPTFGWPPSRLVLLMAGGDAARLAPIGGPEDDADAGIRDIGANAVGPVDAMIAVAASGTTAYTLAAVEAAKARGALTVGIANNADTPLLRAVQHPVLLDTGPEVIAGSTRLNAGTAQKAALGLLSTLVMTRLGHVVDGFMVGVTADNAKLRERAAAILVAITGSDIEAARGALERCAWRVKPAALVVHGLSTDEADTLLRQSGGRLREALAQLPSRP